MRAGAFGVRARACHVCSRMTATRKETARLVRDKRTGLPATHCTPSRLAFFFTHRPRTASSASRRSSKATNAYAGGLVRACVHVVVEWCVMRERQGAGASSDGPVARWRGGYYHFDPNERTRTHRAGVLRSTERMRPYFWNSSSRSRSRMSIGRLPVWVWVCGGIGKGEGEGAERAFSFI